MVKNAEKNNRVGVSDPEESHNSRKIDGNDFC